jgi:tetratricopeptide (TPR) repeat protein
MKSRFYILIILGVALTQWGCATSRLTLLTSPEKAKVYAKPIGAGKRAFLGETPLTIEHDKIEKQYSGSGPVYVEFIKEGFLPYRVYITELARVQTELRADLSPMTGLEDQSGLNFIMESMFEIQRLSKVKRYDEALKILDQVQEKAPYMSSVYEMKGGIYYLRGAYRDAYDSYARAVTLNPKNADSQRMKEHLQEAYGYNSHDDPMDIQSPRMPSAKTQMKDAKESEAVVQPEAETSKDEASGGQK